MKNKKFEIVHQHMNVTCPMQSLEKDLNLAIIDPLYCVFTLHGFALIYI